MISISAFAAGKFLKPRAIILFLSFVSLLFLASCGRPVANFEDEGLVLQDRVSLGQLEREIRRTAKVRKWKTKRLRAGRLEATYRAPKDKYVLVVDIFFTRTNVSVLYKDSQNLSFDGTTIHRKANRYMRNLKKAIIRRAKSIKPRTGVFTAESGAKKFKFEPTSFGTGFVIMRSGLVLTNNHVAGDCAVIKIDSNNFKVIAQDKTNDMALLKGKLRKGRTSVQFRSGRSVSQGSDVIVAGYPLMDLLKSKFNVTKGTVSAFPDTRLIQITAPVQPGNSGGPLLDSSGNIAGVIVSKMKAKQMVHDTGFAPENIGFAIKGAIARAFLDTLDAPYRTARSSRALSTEEIARKAQKFTVPVLCWE